MQPWKLVADPTGYIFRWLVAYSALLGAVGGMLIADYFVIRRTRLDLAGLYKKDGPYWYAGGFNLLALIALVLGIAPCVPGFLAAVSDSWKADRLPPICELDALQLRLVHQLRHFVRCVYGAHDDGQSRRDMRSK